MFYHFLTEQPLHFVNSSKFNRTRNIHEPVFNHCKQYYNFTFNKIHNTRYRKDIELVTFYKTHHQRLAVSKENPSSVYSLVCPACMLGPAYTRWLPPQEMARVRWRVRAVSYSMYTSREQHKSDRGQIKSVGCLSPLPVPSPHAWLIAMWTAFPLRAVLLQVNYGVREFVRIQSGDRRSVGVRTTPAAGLLFYRPIPLVLLAGLVSLF